MENASGDWNLVAGEQRWEVVLFYIVCPFLDILNFALYKKIENEETYSTQSVFLYYRQPTLKNQEIEKRI